MTPGKPAVPAPSVRANERQLLLLALCGLGLVVAAFAAPPATAGPSPPNLPILGSSGDQKASECVVSLDETPVPGRQVTVTVRQDAEPVTDVRVWLDDRLVGRTNESGQVEARVPYVRNLEIRVGLPSGGSCEFVTGTARRQGGESASIAVSSGPTSALPAGVADTAGSVDAAQAAPNVTGTYTVRGGMDVGVDGRPDPGSEISLVATIGGEPVPDATVVVDGREVGATDERGRKTIRVPDDGTKRLRVRVERGEFRSARFVHVRLLQVALDGSGLVPLPGQEATAVATIGTERIEGAVVSVGGERIGSTDATGSVAFELPANPIATVTVTEGDRTASARVLAVYAPTIVAGLGAFVTLVLGPLAAFWAGGRRAIGALAALVTLVLVAAGGYAVAGSRGALVAVLSVAGLALVAAAVRRPDAASDAAGSAGGRFSAFAAWIAEQALWVAGAVESLVVQTRDRIRSILNRLRNWDRSLVDDLRSWLAAVPGRLRTLVWYVVGAPRRLVGRFRSAQEASTDDADAACRKSAGGDGPDRAIRAFWRRFASRVVPDDWPRRTPGEVSRRAVEAGFPRDPVVELTAVFRDVEYGDVPLSDERYERARTAFEALDEANGSDDGASDDGEVSES